MAREPQRREQPAPISAAIVPFERALIARAKAIEAHVDELVENNPDDEARLTDAHALATVAQEFRALAEELKYW